MARYYALSIQPTLFGEAAIVRCWGRIGKRGGEKSEVFSLRKWTQRCISLNWPVESAQKATNRLETVEIRRDRWPFPPCVRDSARIDWQRFRINHDAETNDDDQQ